MRSYSEDRAEIVACCAAGYAVNLLPALASKPLPEAYAALQEMFRDVIATYFAGSGGAPPPSKN
jgi:hypothetical protein